MPINRQRLDQVVERMLAAAEADHPDATIGEAVLVLVLADGDASEVRVRYAGPNPVNGVALLQSAAANLAAAPPQQA